MTPKPWYLSKTVWLNVAIILSAIIAAVLEHADIVGKDATNALTIVLAVLGVVNRFLAENPPLTLR